MMPTVAYPFGFWQRLLTLYSVSNLCFWYLKPLRLQRNAAAIFKSLDAINVWTTLEPERLECLDKYIGFSKQRNSISGFKLKGKLLFKNISCGC